jgi:ribosomal protein S18 acetylase RimI-like enzyme
MDLQLTDTKTPEVDELVAGVRRFNTQQAGDGGSRPLAVLARDETGRLIGGVAGRTIYGHWLIEVLWVDAAQRGSGLGRRLMEQAEREAVARGCVAAQVDTLSFQAPDFYRKLGFEVVGRIEGFPAGHDRCFMLKRFVDQA